MTQTAHRAGELDDRIVIQRNTTDLQTGQDPDFGGEVETLETFATVWSDFNPIGGSEFFAAQQRTAKRIGTFTIRPLAGLKESMRIVFDGDIWDIDRIDLIGRKSRVMIFAQARAGQ